MEWWQMTKEQLAEDADARLAKRLAYYNTFYGTVHGREVLVDIIQMCYSFSSDPVAMLARIEVVNRIRANAGATVDSDKAAIDAEAEAINLGE